MRLDFTKSKIARLEAGVIFCAVVVFAAIGAWLSSTDGLMTSREAHPDLDFRGGGFFRTMVVHDSVRISDLSAETFRILDRLSPGHGFATEDLRIEVLNISGRKGQTIRYDFFRCVRARYDLRSFKYIVDHNDPVAKSRNMAMHQAIRKAAETLKKVTLRGS